MLMINVRVCLGQLENTLAFWICVPPTSSVCIFVTDESTADKTGKQDVTNLESAP